jgi:D-alanyl-D-alanine carboxypeptidase
MDTIHLARPAMATPLALSALLALLCACASGHGAPPAAGPPPQPAATAPEATLLDSLVRAHLDMDPSIPGAQVAVWHAGHLLLSRGYGTADLAAAQPVGTGTVFQIASATKPITAAAVVRLAEEGRLSLDDPLDRWVPEYPTGGQRVTLRHLLTHTSGIPNFAHVNPDWLAEAGTPLDPAESLARMGAHPLLFEPGERFDYSNTGYFLLGIVVERAANRSYAEYVRDALTAPLGLSTPGYCPDAPTPSHARGYRSTEQGNLPAHAFDMSRAYAAGAMFATAQDLVHWTRTLHAGRIVAPALVREMATPATVRTGRTSYGLGLVASSLAGHTRIMHGGGMPGFSAQAAYYPEHDLAVAVLYNTGDAPPARLEVLLARAVLGLEIPATVNLPVPSGVRAALAGDYALAGTRLRVFEREGALWAMVEGQSPARLLYQGGHEFRAVFDPSVRFVFDVEGDTATGLVLHQAGAEIQATRL